MIWQPSCRPTGSSVDMSVSYETIALMAGRRREKQGPRGKAGDALRAMRADQGLTQEQAARLLGVSRSWLALVETGRKRPRGLLLLGLMTRIREIGGQE